MRGFIYILSNPSLPGLLKIGKTSKDPKTRGDELYATGTPEPFKLEYMAFSDDMDSLERMVHKKLDSYRPNKDREFFKVSRMTAINTIQRESKNCGELKFEEKNFKSADDFWEMAKVLFTENQERENQYKDEENLDLKNILTRKYFLAVQKPNTKNHAIIFPPQTRAISLKGEEYKWEDFDDEIIWSIDVAEVSNGEKRRRLRLTEKGFEDAIENNFARAFPSNPHGSWVLGKAETYYGYFRPWLNDEPFYCESEDEIITRKVLSDRIATNTTKYHLKVKKEEEDKQRILREKEFKKAERERIAKEWERKHSRDIWWIILIVLGGIIGFLIKGGVIR